jgi:SAM-dependent methyltransferase
MKRFWDARADEDAFYFVDNRLEYSAPDTQRFWNGGKEDLETILNRLEVELRPADRVVEIGCGVGRITRELCARTAHVAALDVSERMLDLAREYNEDLETVEWILGDGESLREIGTCSADVCFSHVVFQHIPDPEVTLGYVREMGRVLAPGGYAAFQVSNAPQIHRRPDWTTRLNRSARGLLHRGPRGQLNPAWRGSAIELDALREVSAQAGMEARRIIGEGTQFCFVLLVKTVS